MSVSVCDVIGAEDLVTGQTHSPRPSVWEVMEVCLSVSSPILGQQT